MVFASLFSTRSTLPADSPAREPATSAPYTELQPDEPAASTPMPGERPQETNRADLFNVEGLVAVVTGGGTGIGLMMATALENNGATVYIVGRRIEVLEKAAAERNRFGKIIALQGDVTSVDDLQRIASAVQARHGYVNLLVNNAGVALNILPRPLSLHPAQGTDLPASAPALPPHGTSHNARLEDSDVPAPSPSIVALQSQLWSAGSPADFARTFATNATAPYYTSVAFLPLLDAGNRSAYALGRGVTSQVLTVSSSGGFRRDADVYSVSYTLSKAAATHLGKLLANLLAGHHIRSNILAPGIFPSEMTGFIGPDQVRAGVPLGRAGGDEDVAGTILFLASRAGAYVNGAVHLLDGGRIGLFSSTY